MNRKVFMFVTAILSILSFNFNKLISLIISWVCINVTDKYIPRYGIYAKYVPIDIIYAEVDSVVCTNKFALILNWYWDQDIDGISLHNIFIKGQEMHIFYKYKDSNVHRYAIIDLNNRTKMTEDHNISEILFGELTF